MEEEQVHEEAVTGGRELGGAVGGNVEFGGQEARLEREALIVVKRAEDEPDGFMPAFFGKELV